MTYALENLVNNKARSQRQRVGRGIGSGRGKTSCRGQKGAKARSGYKRRASTEGGGAPIYSRMPTRGFTRGRFLRPFTVINLLVIEKKFNDGEEVNLDSLKAKGIIKRKKPYPLKILGQGEITKKVKIQAKKYTKNAIEKLEKAKATIQKLET